MRLSILLPLTCLVASSSCAAGGHRLGVCNGADMLKPGYREVFMKYSGRPPVTRP